MNRLLHKASGNELNCCPIILSSFHSEKSLSREVYFNSAMRAKEGKAPF